MGSMARAISTRDLAPLLLWPETETDIEIKNFGDFFLAAIETVIVNHRKMLVKVSTNIFMPVNRRYPRKWMLDTLKSNDNRASSS